MAEERMASEMSVAEEAAGPAAESVPAAEPGTQPGMVALPETAALIQASGLAGAATPFQAGAATAAGDAPEPPRSADHIAIDRLAGGLVPALIARLAATGLGEIEIRQDGWKVRVRRPADSARRMAEAGPRRGAGHAGPSRLQPGHAGHGHAPAALERHDGHAPGNGHETASRPDADAGDDDSIIVTSPAVGVYRPGKGQAAGARVRSGDRIGAVDMLGVAQEVVAPVDGILGESVVEPGEAVEYGQEIVRVVPARAAR